MAKRKVRKPTKKPDSFELDKMQEILAKPIEIGLPESLADVDFGRDDVPVVQARSGRPKKSKNETTVFRDQMIETFEKQVKKSFKKIILTVCEAAEDGNMKAADMVLSRIVPVNKAVDGDTTTGTFSVNINIGNLVAPEILKKPDDVVSEQ